MESAIFIFWIVCLLSCSSAIKTYIFESLPNGFAADLADDFVYSGRLQSFGDLSSRDKTVTIATSWSNADRLMFYFELLDIKGTRGNCSDSYLQIFDKGRAEKATLEGLEDRICGIEIINGTFTTISNALTFIYVTPKGSSDSWGVIFTAFHEGHCNSYEYRCRNERCISHSLRCQGHDPCGDGSDCMMTYGAVAAIVLGGACAVGFMAAVVFVMYKNRKRLYRKHKRQPHTFTPAHSFENLTAADFCQESVTSLHCPPQKC